MTSARQHATETRTRTEPRRRSRPPMPAMPAGPDYWPVPVADHPEHRAGRSSARPDGRVRVQAP